MLRWRLWRPLGWMIALHCIMQRDDDRALHDHVGNNLSIILKGCYLEIFSHAWQPLVSKVRRPFVPYYRRAETPHRIFIAEPVWSLWIRWPHRREWGFWCPKGWRHWLDFTAENGNISTVGRGCSDEQETE